MKLSRLFSVLSACVVLSLQLSAQDLGSLWKRYDEAALSDRPQDELEILSDIKGKASRSRSTWDYFRACDLYASVLRRIDRRSPDEARSRFRDEVERYGDPVAIFRFRRSSVPVDSLLQYVDSYSEHLSKQCNRGFYDTDRYISSLTFAPALLPLIDNDYEYALWSLFAEKPGNAASSALRETLAYPKNAFLEYLSISGNADDTAALREFSVKYAGKSVSLLSRSDLLSGTLFSLMSDGNASEKDYLALRSDCMEFERERASFTGLEKETALCCTMPREILDILEAEEVASIEGNHERISVAVRNLGEVNLRLASNGRTVFSKTVPNLCPSFFVPDTLDVDLPDLDDGVYGVECAFGRTGTPFTYNRYSLSLSVRHDSGGYGCYVADSGSGEPVGGCVITSSGEEVGTSDADGFARLSCRDATSFQAFLTGPRLRMSPVVKCASPRNLSPDVSVRTILDRKAFNPGDTLHYKVIACRQGAVAEGCPLKAILKDAGGNTVGTETLITGEFGSAAGSFVLEDGSRNGKWSLQVYSADDRVSSSAFSVDEFVLPSFMLIWDRQEHLYLDSEKVTLTGTLRSLSGHNLSESRICCTVDGEPAGDFNLSPDGRFSFSFIPSGRSAERTFHDVNVMVTESTGETVEFSGSARTAHEIPLKVTLLNPLKAVFSLKDSKRILLGVPDGDVAELDIGFGGLERNSVEVSYSVFKDGSLYDSGCTMGSARVNVKLEGAPDGVYTLNVTATDGENHTEYEGFFVRAVKSAADVGLVFRYSDSGAICAGVSDRPSWVAAEFFDDSSRLLDRAVFRLCPGEPLREFYLPGSCDGTLYLLSFRDDTVYSISREVCKSSSASPVPLLLTGVPDSASPGDRYTLQIRTAPGVECAASIFDLGTEKIFPNKWAPLSFASKTREVSHFNACGTAFIPTGRRIRGVRNTSGPYLNSASEAGDAVPLQIESDDAPAVRMRYDFSPSIAWEPFLRSDADGNAVFSFTASDRLSTYAVQIVAHDKTLNSSVLREEMTVTLPVKLAAFLPRFLHEGDSCVLPVTVSSSAPADIIGRVSVALSDSSSVFFRHSDTLAVQSGGSAACFVPLKVPQGSGKLEMVSSFESGSGSDAVRFAVPVLKSCQRLTESHSSLLHEGESSDSLLAELRGSFVNVDGALAVPHEISIFEMLKKAVPEKVSTDSEDVLSLSDALLANLLSRTLGGCSSDEAGVSDLKSRISVCRSSGGGWAWFKGMEPSPIITALMLEKLSMVAELDPSLADAFNPAESVRWLDDNRFDDPLRPLWCGAVSLEQYLYVRSLYPEVPFSPRSGDSSLKEFKNKVRDYLVPRKERGLTGRIISKARRLGTLNNLMSLECGRNLARSWGVALHSGVRRSFDADLASLLQYAVKHPSGGCHYPNAFLPSRGLLEGELYAHTLLCRLLSDAGTDESKRVADGLRLWMMVQKETQQWGNDPAYLEALCCVLESSPAMLRTRVLVLSAEYSRDFSCILPSGNGFSAERIWLREDGSELRDGDMLRLGEKICARYLLRNDENRSFVRLTVPRPAMLLPAEQLSGPCGGYLSPTLSSDGWKILPRGYRSVLTDRSEYWFDICPGGNTVVNEKFLVCCEGRFSCGAAVIESLYAPHYRANGSASVLSAIR